MPVGGQLAHRAGGEPEDTQMGEKVSFENIDYILYFINFKYFMSLFPFAGNDDTNEYAWIYDSLNKTIPAF